MIGPVQHRNPSEYTGLSLVRARREALSETFQPGGGGSHNQHARQDARTQDGHQALANAARLRSDIEDAQEPERWDGLA